MKANSRRKLAGRHWLCELNGTRQTRFPGRYPLHVQRVPPGGPCQEWGGSATIPMNVADRHFRLGDTARSMTTTLQSAREQGVLLRPRQVDNEDTDLVRQAGIENKMTRSARQDSFGTSPPGRWLARAN